MYTLSLPTSIHLGGKKNNKFALNLNEYRNTHFHSLNKAKVLFKKIVEDSIKQLPTMTKVELIFTLFMGSHRSADLSNICSIVDKFFCDALVELGKLPTDSFEAISSVDYRFGGVEKGNPRVDVTLVPLATAEEEPMQIIIVQSEIETAIRNHILSQITVNEGTEINIDLSATRGAEGFKATIDIVAAATNGKAAPKLAAVTQTQAPKVEQAEVAETATETVADTTEEAPSKERNIEVNEAGEVEQPAEARSLFAGLNKPKNS